MTDVVMVGVDGSEDSADALTWSTNEAARKQCQLKLVYCLHVPLVAQQPFGAPSLAFAATGSGGYGADYAEQILQAGVSLCREVAPDLDVRTEVLKRPAAAGLLEASAKASLMVLGTRGLGTLGSLFLGSVSMRLCARSFCPTVVVPLRSGHRDVDGNIVVGVDGSKHGDAALRFALEQAALWGSSVTVVYGHRSGGAEDSTSTDPEGLVAEALDRARRGEFADVEVQAQVLDTSPADAVVAASHGASLTVVGSRGRGGFAGMMLGSVSQSVLHRVENPVAVLSSREKFAEWQYEIDSVSRVVRT